MGDNQTILSCSYVNVTDLHCTKQCEIIKVSHIVTVTAADSTTTVEHYPQTEKQMSKTLRTLMFQVLEHFHVF